MYIKGKVARGIGILYKSRPHFSLETMRMLYNAFVYPYFTYCIEVWGNTCQSYLDPLVKLQKRTAPLSKSVRVTGVSLYNHFKSLICLKVSYVTYKYNLKRHIFDNNTLNLVTTS